MADEILTGKDEDEIIEVVEVDELPEPGKAPAPQAKDAEEPEPDDAEDDEEDDEDERLASDEDDVDDEIASKSRQKRLKRREMQRAARERAENAIQELRRTNAALVKRLESLEHGVSTQTAQQIEAELASTQAEITQIEQILANAVESGDGAAVTEAMRLRDAARDKELVLKSRKDQRTTPVQGQRVVLAQAWVAANRWYNPNGVDAYSTATKELDVQLQSEGYNPDSVEFWKELTNRVNKRFGAEKKPKASKTETEVDDTDTPRRKGPPVGGAKGAKTPVAGAGVVHVTPARKQAMIDAGVWDDPERRNRMLKAYRDFDRNNASR